MPSGTGRNMNNAVYIAFDFFAALVLFIIMDRSRSFLLSKKDRIFRQILVTTIVVLVFDASTWLFNGGTGAASLILNNLSHYAYWFASLLPCYFSLLYCVYAVSPELYKRIRFTLSMPLWIGVGLLLLNEKSGWIFTVTSNNLYQQGPYFLLVGSLPFIHMGLAIALTLAAAMRTPKNQRKQYEMLTFFMSFPVLGSLLSIFMYGYLTFWPEFTLAMLMSYVYFQKGDLSLDALTNINNRRRFDDYCTWKWRNLGEEENLVLIVLDINDFKSINDNFGHAEGDSALVLAANALKKVMSNERGFLARIGGDEFAIVLDNVSDETVSSLITRIKAQVRADNAKAQSPYLITFALGYACTYGNQKVDFKKFFSDADKAMYAHKRSFKTNTTVNA